MLFEMRSTCLIKVLSESLQEITVSNNKNKIMWCVFFDGSFLSKALFDVVYKTIKYLIFNPKPQFFKSFLSLFKFKLVLQV